MSAVTSITVAATSKLAQSATRAVRTCQGCGLNKPLADFPIHPRWHTPLQFCDGCMSDKRAAGLVKRRATAAAKAQEKAREAAKTPQTDAGSPPAPKAAPVAGEPHGDARLRYAVLQGFALGKLDKRMERLVKELGEALGYE